MKLTNAMALGALAFMSALNLFSQTRGNPWNNPIVSPQILPGGEVKFSIHCPHAKKVELSGQFMEGNRELSRDENGVWSATVKIGKPDIYPYSFIVDGTALADPSNPLIFPNERFKASLLEMPDASALYTAGDVPHGKVAYCSYYSKTLSSQRPLLVYTPAGYEKSGKKYPVLYLVSGTTDTEETWFKVGRVNTILDNLIARSEAEEMLVVMPYGLVSDYTPMPSSMEAAEMYAKFERELVESIIPFAESEFRVRGDRLGRAIAGFSRGGGQSLFAAFSNLDKFAWIGSYSAYLTPQVMDAYFKDALSSEEFKPKLLWFGVGKGDFLYRDVVKNLKYFDEKGVSYKSVISEGGHTWMNARAYLAETLKQFFKEK